MSFAKDTKLQILNNPLETTECELAFFSGLINVAGEFDPSTKSVSFLTDIPKLYEFTNEITTRLYGKGVGLEIADDIRINKTKYLGFRFQKILQCRCFKILEYLISKASFCLAKLTTIY
ncbi:MAG: hypothetical protein IKY15_02590 [Clostridia bacterium]|nr:hypothetical protein [Clostridia bacterium]